MCECEWREQLTLKLYCGKCDYQLLNRKISITITRPNGIVLRYCTNLCFFAFGRSLTCFSSGILLLFSDTVLYGIIAPLKNIQRLRFCREIIVYDVGVIILTEYPIKGDHKNDGISRVPFMKYNIIGGM